MTSYQTIQVELDARGVLFVTLNRPDIRNAFNEVMIAELTEVFSSRALAAEVRLLVLRGAGEIFSAGGDLNWMRRSVELSVEENLKDTRALTELFALMNEVPKPLIGLIQGAAIGGGVGLVSVCDIVVATEATEFSLSEVRLGIVPACIGPFVVSKIGASQARALFISAERFKAARALAIGLVHQVVGSPVELTQTGERLVTQMLQCGPAAMGVAKRLVLDLSWPEKRVQHPDVLEYVARTLAELRVTPEGQEGVRAFLEKRKPAWLAQKS